MNPQANLNPNQPPTASTPPYPPAPTGQNFPNQSNVIVTPNLPSAQPTTGPQVIQQHAFPQAQPTQAPVQPAPGQAQAVPVTPGVTNNVQIAGQQSLAAYTTPAPQPGVPQDQLNPQLNPEAPKVVENPISTQSTLQFSELRDSLVIMKDGSFRAVVACQSINFDLMSEQEREGVEYSYQNFLNSLTFTTQILVRSQKVDIGPYIEKLIKLRRDNDNMLLGVLMDDYINFIDVLSQEANIMDKSFFIVIPYYSSADLEHAVEQTKNFFKAFNKTKAPTVTRINRDTYNAAIDELNNRVDSVISGLFQIGIQSVRLNTKELSELFYNFNNPDTAVREPLVDFTKVATTYVKKGTKE